MTGDIFAPFADHDDRISAQRRRELEDLRRLTASAEGFRLALRLLRRGGLGRPLPPDGAAVAAHNDALELLRDIFEADPSAGASLTARLFGPDTVHPTTGRRTENRHEED